MRNSWAQPSLSRDFTLLAAAVLFALMLVSGWVTYMTYERHAEQVTSDLEKEAARIESAISTAIGNANYMLSSIGRQIVVSGDKDYMKLAQSLKSFDNKNSIYSIFSWTNTDKKMVVSSNKGVLEEPIDISDRDFIQQSSTDSWRIHIGRPIEGRVSGKWVIPVAMGISDNTGKFIGIISLSIDIGVLTDQIRGLVKRDGISFAVVSKNFVTLTEVSDDKNFITDNFSAQAFANLDFDKQPKALITSGSLIWGIGKYAYYHVSENFPYIVLIGYDAKYSDGIVRNILWSRLLQVLFVAIFLFMFLWIVRVRVVNPVLGITSSIAAITRGERFAPLPRNVSVEIGSLATQVKVLAQYIEENKRIENELRNKMFLLKEAKEKAEMNARSKSEFLAYITQELRVPMNNIVGFSQVLKDQIYGIVENRKYKQYATDIFLTANQVIAKIQDILTLAKTESGYVALQEKPLDIIEVINLVKRQLEDKFQAEKISLKIDIHENIPHLLADEFKLQQILINLLLSLSDNMDVDNFVTITARIIGEHRDRQFLALIIGGGKAAPVSQDRLFALASRLFASMSQDMAGSNNAKKSADMTSDLRFTLAKILLELHNCALHLESLDGNVSSYIIFFPSSRLIY